MSHLLRYNVLLELNDVPYSWWINQYQGQIWTSTTINLFRSLGRVNDFWPHLPGIMLVFFNPE